MTKTMTMTIGIVGAGRAGLSMAQLLRDQGSQVMVYDKLNLSFDSGPNASQWALPRGISVARDERDLLMRSNWLILAVADSEIEKVCLHYMDLYRALVALEGEGAQALMGLVHLSGALGLAPLKSVPTGILACALHPIRAFSRPTKAMGEWDHTYFGFTGCQTALGVWSHLLKEVSDRILTVREEDRPLYHGAAVLASNYTVPFILSGLEAYKRAGFDTNTAKALVRQLVLSVLDNVDGASLMEPISPEAVASVLTGPLMRGDLKTVNGHLQGIKDQNHDHDHDRNHGQLSRIYGCGVLATLELMGKDKEKGEGLYGEIYKRILSDL